MLDIKVLREDTEGVRERLAIKNYQLDVSRVQELEAERKRLQALTETLQNDRNTRSKAIGKAKAAGEDIAPLLAEVGDLGERLDGAKAEFDALQETYQGFLREIPNLPDTSVPAGNDESDNQEITRWGEPRMFEFEPLDHVALTAAGGLDFDTAAKITGSRFVVMHGPLARLHRALVQFMMDVHVIEHGYREVYVPYIVNADSLMGTGQLPKFAEDQFRLEGSNEFYLVPTAEVPVTNIYRDRILSADELPVRHVCHTPCFRSEAGSYGKDTRGMIRQHQFEKVELVMLVRPEDSWRALEELTGDAETILRKLELPYRSVVLCGGDLGFSAAKTIDLEVWLPGQDRYREISSCSNFLDFQARRMLARYRHPESGKPELLHTLNGSGLAVGRTLIAILENYQDGEGRVAVPDALRDYLAGAETLDLSPGAG